MVTNQRLLHPLSFFTRPILGNCPCQVDCIQNERYEGGVLALAMLIFVGLDDQQCIIATHVYSRDRHVVGVRC